jgi:hypothetical protein
VAYTLLPMLYNSVIHHGLVDSLRAATGRVFGSHSPDIYSGFTFAYLAQSYVSLDVPMSIAGLSGKSNGTALLSWNSSPIAEEFWRLNALAGFTQHPWLPNLTTFPVIPVADSFLRAKQALFPDDSRFDLDRRALLTQLVQGLAAASQEEWGRSLDAIRATLVGQPELQTWFDTTLRGQPWRMAVPFRHRPDTLGHDGDSLHVNTAAFAVSNVYEAAQLYDKLHGFRAGTIRYVEMVRPGGEVEDRQPGPRVALHAELQAQERVIQTLRAGCAERDELIRRLQESQRQPLERITPSPRPTRGQRLLRMLGLSRGAWGRDS